MKKLRNVRSIFLYLFTVTVFLSSPLFADEIYLNNGDKISGSITKETSDSLSIETTAMGVVTIARDFIQEMKTDEMIQQARQREEKAKKEPKWDNKLEVGYSQTGGNTKSTLANAKLLADRKTDRDETNMSIEGHYGSSNDQMNTQKFAGMFRHAISFGKSKKWYKFLKLEGNRNRFANINYRLIPSAGVGYWFSDEGDFKAMAEIALGYEHTNYKDNTKSSNEAILVPRGFWEKKLLEKLTLSQDITLYPSLSEFGEYRLHLVTDLTHPINDELSWKLSFIDDYNSNPSGNTKKNDYTLTSSVVYSF